MYLMFLGKSDVGLVLIIACVNEHAVYDEYPCNFLYFDLITCVVNISALYTE